MFSSSPHQIALSVFGVYVLFDERNVLDAQKIFVSVALINILKTPLSQLPFAMNTTMQARSLSVVWILIIIIWCSGSSDSFNLINESNWKIWIWIKFLKMNVISPQAVVSLKRLTNFLSQDEVRPDNVERRRHSSGANMNIEELIHDLLVQSEQCHPLSCMTPEVEHTGECAGEHSRTCRRTCRRTSRRTFRRTCRRTCRM